MFGWFRGNATVQPAGAGSSGLALAPEARATSLGEDGIAFLHTGSGKLFTANAMGARIWRGLEEKASLASIAASISSELGIPLQQVEEDAAEFVTALEAGGLVSSAGARA